jgi:hydrogenase/urease accessory protein HupE
MKRIFPVALLTPTAALAHPGDHGGFSVQAILTHLLSEPDHLALAVAAVALPLVLVYRARKRK